MQKRKRKSAVAGTGYVGLSIALLLSQHHEVTVVDVISNAAVPVISSNLIAIKASGRSDIYVRLEMIRRVVMLAILLVSVFVFRSVEAIAISFCISNWPDAMISMVPAKKLLDYSIGDQFRDLWKIIAVSATMFAVVLAMELLPISAYLLLPLQILAGVAIYVALGFFLKIESQATLVKLLQKLTKGRKDKAFLLIQTIRVTNNDERLCKKRSDALLRKT